MTDRAAVRFTLDEVDFFERPVHLRMPFRFGIVTLTEAPQRFCTVRITTDSGITAYGRSAQLLAPKWFDKNPALSNEDNFEQLRRATALAAEAYREARTAQSAFRRFETNMQAIIDAAAREGLNPLVASFGPACVDAAILDALGRALGLSFYALMRSNLAGIDADALAPDLAGFDLDAWLRTLSPATRIAARHTVGLVDPIDTRPLNLDDGLPESLIDVVERYGHRHFKLKVGGDVEADLERLIAIATVIQRIEGPLFVSLDGNEQYDDAQGVIELWHRMQAEPRLDRLVAATEFIEQPIKRSAAMSQDVHALSALRPVIIDESDGTLDSFPQAIALGYRGVSSKLCKGLYKSIINAARCVQRSRSGAPPASPFFMSGEDLTNQAGIAVQQDLALVNLLGITHVERNGHHYVDGMAGATAAEQRAFADAHPDLYRFEHGTARLAIADGHLRIGSLDCPGFAVAVDPQRAYD